MHRCNGHPTGEAEPAARELAACRRVSCEFVKPLPSRGACGGAHTETGVGLRTMASERRWMNSGVKRLQNSVIPTVKCIPGKLNHRERSLHGYTVFNAQREFPTQSVATQPLSSWQHSRMPSQLGNKHVSHAYSEPSRRAEGSPAHCLQNWSEGMLSLAEVFVSIWGVWTLPRRKTHRAFRCCTVAS